VSPEILEGLEVSDTLYAAVDHIVEHRELPDGSTQYRARWEMQGPELDSWLFQKDFIDYGPLKKYSKAMGIDVRTKKVKVTSTSKPGGAPTSSAVHLFGSLKSGSAQTVVLNDLVNASKDTIPKGGLVRASNLATAKKAVQESQNPIEIYLDKQQKNALS